MYKIIGADGKAYGPVTPEQIRQWISEARINSETQVLVEGSQEWKPLSDYPEFADLLGSNAAAAPSIPGYQPPGASRDKALQDVKGPAIGLKVTAIVGLIFVALALALNVLTIAGVSIGIPHGRGNQMLLGQMSGGLGILRDIAAIAIGIVILNGASKMAELKNHQFAFTAAILAMLPCVSPCCLLGLPFGIWALVVLNRPDIKSQFS
jgi:hypothetical protein